jgi:hypothetical protein
MPIPLGILAAAGASQAPAGSFVLLETTVLTGSQASVEFTNLTSKYASTYQHLQLRAVVRSARSATDDDIKWRLNADSASNYTIHRLWGNGSSVNSGAGTSQTSGLVGYVAAANSPANSFGAVVMDILDPFETTKNTTLRILSGNTSENLITLASGVWLNTNSVTQLNLFSQNSANLVTGSRFSLYGLKAA